MLTDDSCRFPSWLSCCQRRDYCIFVWIFKWALIYCSETVARHNSLSQRSSSKKNQKRCRHSVSAVSPLTPGQSEHMPFHDILFHSWGHSPPPCRRLHPSPPSTCSLNLRSIQSKRPSLWAPGLPVCGSDQMDAQVLAFNGLHQVCWSLFGTAPSSQFLLFGWIKIGGSSCWLLDVLMHSWLSSMIHCQSNGPRQSTEIERNYFQEFRSFKTF